MARSDDLIAEETQPLYPADHSELESTEEKRRASISTTSTTSLVFEHMSNRATLASSKDGKYLDQSPTEHLDVEEQLAWQRTAKPADRKARRMLYIFLGVGLLGWLAALFLFLSQQPHIPHAARPHDPHATKTAGFGQKVTLDQVLGGEWYAQRHAIEWIAGPNGEDGLLLERGGNDGRDYLVVEDVRFRGEELAVQIAHSTTLMVNGMFQWNGEIVYATDAYPSPDHKKVLVKSDHEKNWRHSSTGRYWIFDVATQRGEPLDATNIHGRVQAASWSPKSNSVVFTRDNNLFIRHINADTVRQITTDGGPDLFYGIPDWVYEEEVLASGDATWWSGDGKFVAYFRTDESNVPSFPVQYFFSRPSGKQPSPGEENYPEVRQIKYPKAGAPMSTVSLEFFDVEKGEVFRVPIKDDFADHDRLITEVLWAGETGKVIVRSTNRESDILKIVLIDAIKRSGKTVRERNVLKLDGGWFEVTQTTTFIPADPKLGRKDDGYVDTVIHDGYDHLAYFTPLDNPEPQMLTSGKWEVVDAPSKIDLEENLVYFIATKDGSTQRHLYSVDLLATNTNSVKSVTKSDEIAYYGASFSVEGKFMLLSYQGPGIPWQKVQSTPSNKNNTLEVVIEQNEELNELAKKTELPIKVYQTVDIDGFAMNLVERRPPHFDESGKRKYPVLFFLYNGPGFQSVDYRFSVDFQAYVASSLGYIVVTLDGFGTGFLGRELRCKTRGNLGYWEAYSQIAAAKMWAAKKYVDEEHMAIWGWSYGGFMTLKTLEMDAGQTFHYGIAVAPVTDWRFYDSIYTERYMHTPQHNPSGYDNATISNMGDLSKNVRFLVMHGVSDDNVHFQNTLQLLDKLDQANVQNYDVHVFPDSDHSIYFHNANRVVYEKLRDWLVNAFNGEWLRVEHPEPARYDVVPA